MFPLIECSEIVQHYAPFFERVSPLIFIGAVEPSPTGCVGAFPGTCIKPKGVLSVEDTLLTHYGQNWADCQAL